MSVIMDVTPALAETRLPTGYVVPAPQLKVRLRKVPLGERKCGLCALSDGEGHCLDTDKLSWATLFAVYGEYIYSCIRLSPDDNTSQQCWEKVD